MRTGKSKKKAWKRMVTKATFVGEGFTRKPVKMERFIRPMALRYKKANVTHRSFLFTLIPSCRGTYRFVYPADLKATFQLQILGVKKNPQSPMYTQLGVLTKGTIIEVNVSELGMVTAGGKVVFGKYAQVTNNPENDGCINAVLRASSSFLIFHRKFLTNVSQLSELFLRASSSYALFSYYAAVSVNFHRFESCRITSMGSCPTCTNNQSRDLFPCFSPHTFTPSLSCPREH